MFETIPAASVAGMAFTLIVAVGVPIAAFILAVTKLRAGALNALIGAGTFIVSCTRRCSRRWAKGSRETSGCMRYTADSRPGFSRRPDGSSPCDFS